MVGTRARDVAQLAQWEPAAGTIEVAVEVRSPRTAEAAVDRIVEPGEPRSTDRREVFLRSLSSWSTLMCELCRLCMLNDCTDHTSLGESRRIATS
jgi:hypothetical protein